MERPGGARRGVVCQGWNRLASCQTVPVPVNRQTICRRTVGAVGVVVARHRSASDRTRTRQAGRVPADAPETDCEPDPDDDPDDRGEAMPGDRKPPGDYGSDDQGDHQAEGGAAQSVTVDDGGCDQDRSEMKSRPPAGVLDS